MHSPLIMDVSHNLGTPRHPTTPRTYKAAKSKNVNLLTQAFRMAHQSIHVDVDLENKRIEGNTELVMLPTKSSLQSVKLDCREMRIKRVTINNKYAADYVHSDLLYINDDKILQQHLNANSVSIFDLYSDNITINQHHFIRQKLNYIFGELNYDPRDGYYEMQNGDTEELLILLPESLKHDLMHGNYSHTPLSGPSTLTPHYLKSKNTSNDTYAPISIKIEYECKNPKNGINFVTSGVDRRDWHAYTCNSEYNISTSSWVPCIDNLWDRCTWSLEISIPRTIADIGNPRLIGSDEVRNSKNKNDTNSKPSKGSGKSEKDAEKDEESSREGENEISGSSGSDLDSADELEENHDLIVCIGDLNNSKETPHPIDLSKKVVSCSIFNPVCAHHIGWAVGSFQTIELLGGTSNDDEYEDQVYGESFEKEINSVPIMIFCMPSQLSMAKNTCIFANKAIEYFLREYGAFPFSSYSIVFVLDASLDLANFAGLSIFSDRILYPPDLIEPMIQSTDFILDAISAQWSGISIVPLTFNDFWCTIGISRFMAFQFIKILMGQNEYRSKIKTGINEVVEKDIGKKPLALQYFRFPISENDFDFLRLKAPLVLFILDKRMTKTDKSFGLSRVLPKIFLQAMSGDLHNSALSTQHFQYVCEKVNRNKLETFFKQWIFGAGVPIFNVTQKFNRKRSTIEMNIRQVQHLETKNLHPKSDTFLNDSIAYLDDEPSYLIPTVFTGPMTIRVHEADGTPYEHIVDLKEGNVKLDIRYNTKLKKLKKNKDENGEPTASFSRLGDVLNSEDDMKEWRLTDWAKTEEDILNDGFEWIRVDADFEWISKINVKQPFYMFISQLQYDRDVEAQYDAVNFFAESLKPPPMYFTALTRTIMDKRYYYGVRIAAAEALGKLSTMENEFAGVWYLIKIFQNIYCFPNSLIPKSNDFNNFSEFFLQKAIPEVLSNIKAEEGKIPKNIKVLLLNLVKYNENSSNSFQDSYYLSDLIKDMTKCAINSVNLNEILDPVAHAESDRDHILKSNKFVSNVVKEIERLQKLDEWLPSFHSSISVVCLRQKILLAFEGILPLKFEDIMYYTTEKYPIGVRLEAFRGLLLLGGLRNASILNYFMKTCLLSFDSSNFKTCLIKILIDSICETATKGTPSLLDDPEFNTLEKLFLEKSQLNGNSNGMVIVEEGSTTEMNSRRDKFARETLNGAIKILRRDLSIGKGLKHVFWELLHTSLIGIKDKRDLFNVCEVIYEPVDELFLTLSIPCVPFSELKRKIVARNLGQGNIILKREGRFKLQLGSRKISLTQVDKKETSRRGEKRSLDAPDKLKVKFNKPSNNPSTRNSKRARDKSLVTVVRENGYNVSIKLPNSVLRGMHNTSLRTLNRDQHARVDGSVVSIHIRNNIKFTDLMNRTMARRYVKILFHPKSVSASFEPFADSSYDEKNFENLEHDSHKSTNLKQGLNAPARAQSGNINGSKGAFSHNSEESEACLRQDFLPVDTDSKKNPSKTSHKKRKGSQTPSKPTLKLKLNLQ